MGIHPPPSSEVTSAPARPDSAGGCGRYRDPATPTRTIRSRRDAMRRPSRRSPGPAPRIATPGTIRPDPRGFGGNDSCGGRRRAELPLNGQCTATARRAGRWSISSTSRCRLRESWCSRRPSSRGGRSPWSTPAGRRFAGRSGPSGVGTCFSPLDPSTRPAAPETSSSPPHPPAISPSTRRRPPSHRGTNRLGANRPRAIGYPPDLHRRSEGTPASTPGPFSKD